MNDKNLVAGNLLPEDDLMHSVSEHESFNESMFFNFFDADKQIGGFVRIGNRPNEGHAEMSFCVFLADGELLMQWAKPAITGNETFEAEGLKFKVIEPGRRFAVSYQGDAVMIPDPFEMTEPGKAMRNNPVVSVLLNLDVSGVGPMIGDREGNSEDSIIFLDSVGHYQQAISATGKIHVGSKPWPLDVKGVRDHSWGPRIWHSIVRDRSLWISFGEDLTFIACKTWLSADEDSDDMGCVIENGAVTALKSIEIHSRFKPGTSYHDGVILKLIDAKQRTHEIHGEVLAYVPLRHRKPGEETVYLGQAMTRFQLGDRSTIGLSEYFDAESQVSRLVEISNSGDYIVE